MDVADKLIEKIFSWMELQKKCADKLNQLASELEENKKIVNVSKVVGSSVSVGGAVAATAAGVLALCTGGAAIPFLGMVGAVGSGLGLATSVGSDIADIVVSSSTMKEATEISEQVENLEKGIQRHMTTLMEEGKRRERQAGDDLSPEDYVVERILRAMAKRYGLKLHDAIRLCKMMTGSSESKIGRSGMDGAFARLGLNVFSQFLLKRAAKKTGKALVSKGLSMVATSAGGKAAAKAAGRVAGRALGLVFSVTELVNNCQNLDNCDPENCQSLRETATAIQTASEELEKDLNEIQKMFKRLAKVKHCIGNSNRSLDERRELIEFAIEKCEDESVRQWLRENSESEAFFKLMEVFHSLEKHINEEEKKNHSNNVDITFVAHGSIRDTLIPASCLLPLSTVTDVVLYTPWNCVITADAAYAIATGLIKPENRGFYSKDKVPGAEYRPRKLPDHWNSMKKAGEWKIPNIIVSPIITSKDRAWKRSQYLTTTYGQPGRNRIVIPFILPEEETARVPFFVVTLALSLVLVFSRFTATVHLTACLGKGSAGQKFDRKDLETQYAYAIDNTGMTVSTLDIFREKWMGQLKSWFV